MIICYNLFMQIKFFHLNIEGGRKLDDVIAYIKENDFDIIHLQEVAGGYFSKDQGVDNFIKVRESLGYHASLSKTWCLKDKPESYIGNATFFKPSLQKNDEEVVWLKPFRTVQSYPLDDIDFIKNLPRNALALQFLLNGKNIWFVNTHLTWGPSPKDEPYKVDQGRILYNFLKELDSPFLLSGDFNVTKESEVVKMIDDLAFNHSVSAGLTNTLNAHLHRAKELFPSGHAVDYIYTSPILVAENFALVDTPDLSDHFGLRIDIIV